jgi:hypothetical protein
MGTVSRESYFVGYMHPILGRGKRRPPHASSALSLRLVVRAMCSKSNRTRDQLVDKSVMSYSTSQNIRNTTRQGGA